MCVCVTQLPVAVGKSRHRAAIHGKDGHAATGHGALGKRRGAAIPAAGVLCGMFSVSLPERNFELENTSAVLGRDGRCRGFPFRIFWWIPRERRSCGAQSRVWCVWARDLQGAVPCCLRVLQWPGDVQCDLCGETVSPLVPGRRVKCRRT